MPDELSPAMLEMVLARTFEEAAFVSLGQSDAPPEVDGATVEATLQYRGDHEGELRLAVSEAFASVLAANMLGEEEGGASVTGDDQDAVGELLNMIGGAVTLEVFGRYAACALGTPRLRRVTPAEHRRALPEAGTVVTLVDEEGRRVDLSSRRGARR